jgi:transposase
LLLEGAQAAGFHTDQWTGPRVAELIERRFGVRYHVGYVGRLLQELDWSLKRRARLALERDQLSMRRL